MKTSSIIAYIECVFSFSLYIANLYLIFIRCRNLMARCTYYVVVEGCKPDIYKSWLDCQRQVNGFKVNLFQSYESLLDTELAYNAYNDEKEMNDWLPTSATLEIKKTNVKTCDMGLQIDEVKNDR